MRDGCSGAEAWLRPGAALSGREGGKTDCRGGSEGGAGGRTVCTALVRRTEPLCVYVRGGGQEEQQEQQQEDWGRRAADLPLLPSRALARVDI